MQNKLNGIKAPFAQVAANAQLAALCCWFLLNAAVCRSLVETIGYSTKCADCLFSCQMLPNAAKCWKNAGKFFPDAYIYFVSIAVLLSILSCYDFSIYYLFLSLYIALVNQTFFIYKVCKEGIIC